MSLNFENPRDRIIVDLGYLPSVEWARCVIQDLVGQVGMFRLGAAAIASGVAGELLRWVGVGKQPEMFFIDGRLLDGPYEVKHVVVHYADDPSVGAVSVHAMGGYKVLRAAVEGAQARLRPTSAALSPKVLAVTVPPYISTSDLYAAGFMPNLEAGNDDAAERMLEFSHLLGCAQRMAITALKAGCNGMVCSARELAVVRAVCGDSVMIAATDIYPDWASKPIRQVQGISPQEAFDLGADVLVIGSPILNPPEGVTREQAVQCIVDEIQAALSARV